jgi:energy-coupling factor transporter ATP-binding protein EcfA2
MIHVENLSYWYPQNKLPALKNVSFRIEPGELVLITGPSGSGKSTLLHCLKGLIPKLYGGRLEGKIDIDGEDISYLSVAEIAKRIGLVMQDPESQFCNLFVRDEVAFGIENLKIDSKICSQRVTQTLDAVGLRQFASRAVTEISGGEKQKVAIASVLAMGVPVLLLDEPTANLDAKSGRDVLQFIDQLRQEGKTLVLVQHELDEMIHVADKLLIMQDGMVIDYGAPRELLQKFEYKLTSDYFIGLPQIAHAALNTQRWFSFESLPLSVAEFASFAQVAPPGSAMEPTGHQDHILETSETIVEAKNIQFSYPNSKTNAIKDISLTVHAGEVVAILGKNGSGKSTLARLMVGLLYPKRGKIKLDGRDVATLKRHEIHSLTGYVFQYPEQQFLTQSVAKEIAYGLEVQQRPPNEISQVVDETIRSLRLAGAENRHPFALSGGEKRRLSVATMLVLEPKLLILDEPTYGLDEGNLLNMIHFLFDQLQKKGVTIVFITHDLRLVAEYAQRVIVLHEGEKLYDSKPAELFNQDRLMEQAELIPPPISELVQALRKKGYALPASTITLDQFSQAVGDLFADVAIQPRGGG